METIPWDQDPWGRDPAAPSGPQDTERAMSPPDPRIPSFADLLRHALVPGTPAGTVARFRAFLRTEAHPFCRTRVDPGPGHFTASALVFRFEAARPREVLLVHRASLGWIQPGGHVEADDRSLRAAALRELREETGVPADAVEALPEALDPTVDLDVHEVPPRPGAPGHLHFDVRFCWRLASSTEPPRLRAGSRWWPLEDPCALPTDASVRRACRRILALYGIDRTG